MSSRLRLIAVLFALLLPGLALVYWTSQDLNSLGSFDDSGIGQRLGGRVVGEVDAWSPEVLDVIRPSKYLLRRYDEPGSPAIWIYVGFYLGVGQLGAGAHDPALCYPAQGWEVIDSRSINLPLENADKVRVQLMRALRDGRQQLVLYWIQPAYRQPTWWAKEQVLRIADALTGHDQYAFVRLSTPYDGDRRNQDQLIEFARALAPRVQTAVRSAGSDSS